MSNLIPINRRKPPSWLSGAHVVTADGQVLRRTGKAGAYGEQFRPVPEPVAVKVLAGLDTAIVSSEPSGGASL